MAKPLKWVSMGYNNQYITLSAWSPGKEKIVYKDLFIDDEKIYLNALNRLNVDPSTIKHILTDKPIV